MSGADGGTSSGAEYRAATEEVRFGEAVVRRPGSIGGGGGGDGGGVRRIGRHAAPGFTRA